MWSTAALARVDLDRVRRALSDLNPRYRDILLAEVGESVAHEPSSVAKVARRCAAVAIANGHRSSPYPAAAPASQLGQIAPSGCALGSRTHGWELQTLLQTMVGVAVVLSVVGSGTTIGDPAATHEVGSERLLTEVPSGRQAASWVTTKDPSRGSISTVSDGKARPAPGSSATVGIGGDETGLTLPGTKYRTGESNDDLTISYEEIEGHGGSAPPVAQSEASWEYGFRASVLDCEDPPLLCRPKNPSAEVNVRLGKHRKTVRVGRLPGS